MKLVLASASPRRFEILKTLVKDFEIIPADIDETIEIQQGENYQPRLCMALAQKKAQAVFENHGGNVLGADTLVFLGEEILGKPTSKKHGLDILSKLSGNTHKVITGVAFITDTRSIIDYEQTYVTFPKLTLEEITDYVEQFSPYDKAGAYGIQEIKDIWDVKLKGSYTNVLGLPKNLVKQMLNMTEEYSV